MKKIAVLVIAATNQPVYVHYIKTYWTELIKYTNAAVPHIDVFLLFENGADIDAFENIEGNIIEDEKKDFDELCDSRFQTQIIPGVLSKTVYALEKLQDQYDVFFRTNLSSVIKVSAFDNFVQTKDSICYSGAWAWVDSLRKDLLYHNRVGPGKSIAHLSELDMYKGDTFISGAGYFLSSDETKSLIRRKEQIRYDIVDDVSMGLMFSKSEVLQNFARIVNKDQSISKIMEVIRNNSFCHIRLTHLPIEHAQALWQQLGPDEIWK